MATNTTDRNAGLGGGVAIKAPVKAAATTNIALTGEQSIGGISCVAGDAVLLAGQTTASENGIYLVSTTAWTRRADCDGSRDLVTGTQVQVLNGSDAGTWRVTTTGTITVGTTSTAWAKDTNTGSGNGDMSSTANLSDVADVTVSFDNISPLTTAGDVLYHDGTNNVRLPKGTSGQFLKIGASIPEWATPAGAGDLLAANNLSDVASAATARTNLGLGALAVKATVATADIDASAVTYAKIQNVAANRILGSIAGGAPEEITCTSAGRAILDDADASAQRTTLGLGTMATQSAAAVAITGGTITGLPTPSSASDAATKAYADSIASALQPKEAVRAATTAALPANTYANGASGVGATLTGNVNGAISAQDGITLILNDRVLVKNESTGANNGIYYVSTVGDGSNPYVLTRATDCDAAADIAYFQTSIAAGTVNANTKWQCVNTGVTVGTTALTITRDYGAISQANLTKLDNFALWTPSDATGSTDMTTELEAFVVANQGKIVKVAEGSTILLNAAFTSDTTSHIEIDFGNTTIKRNNTSTSALFCDNTANASSEQTVSAIAEETINTDATISKITIGGTLSASRFDWIALYSTDANPAQSGGQLGEIFQLITDEASLVLRATRKLNKHGSYATTIRVRKLDATRRVMIRGGIFTANGDAEDTAITSRGTADIVIRGFVEPVVENVIFDSCWGTGLRLQACAAWRVNNNLMRNIGNLANYGGFTYGLTVYGMNDSGVASNLHAWNGRHGAFTTDGNSSGSGTWYNKGIPTNCVFDGIHGFNAHASVADTHPEGDGIIIRNVTSYHSEQDEDIDPNFTGLAIQIRSSNTIVDGLICYGGNRGIVVNSEDHGFEDHVFLNNICIVNTIDKASVDRDYGIYIKDGQSATNKRHVHITNLVCSDAGTVIYLGKTQKMTLHGANTRDFDIFLNAAYGSTFVSTGEVALDYRDDTRTAPHYGVVLSTYVSSGVHSSPTVVFMKAPSIIKGNAANKPANFFTWQSASHTGMKYIYSPPLVEYNPSGVTATGLYDPAMGATYSVVSVTGAGGGGLQASSNLSDVAVPATAFNNISPLTAKGDILVGFGATDSRRFAVSSSNNQVLVTDSTQTLGVKWANIADTLVGASLRLGNSATLASIKIPYDINNASGHPIVQLMHIITDEPGVQQVGYGIHSYITNQSSIIDAAALGGGCATGKNSSAVWGAAIQAIGTSLYSGCTVHGMELNVHNYNSGNNPTVALLIGCLGSAPNGSAIQINSNIAGGTNCKFNNGIVFDNGAQQPVSGVGSLIYCVGGSYGTAINLGTSAFGYYILQSSKLNIEGGTGQLNFLDSAIYENAGTHLFAGTSYTGRYLLLKANGGTQYRIPLFV